MVHNLREDDDITLLVFHSYPGKPCYDGALSCLAYVEKNKREGIRCHYLATPYTRQLQSYQTVKLFLEYVKSKAEKGCKVKVVYLDISPEHEEELEDLESLQNNLDIKIEINDHHSSRHFDRLKNSFGDGYTYSKGNCASIQCAKDEQDETWKAILCFVQFSEYESEDPAQSGVDECKKRANKVFENSVGNFSEIASWFPELERVYYILDNMMAVPEEWAKLYPKEEVTSEMIKTLNSAFWECSKNYYEKLKKIVNGKAEDIFSVEELREHQRQQAVAKEILKASNVVELPVNGVSAKVLCANIDFMKFGRSLEPLARDSMNEKGAQYCIFFNPPKNNHYYLSLRRVDQRFDATHLATAVKELSGSKVGGGHPWAAGCNLTSEQYNLLLQRADISFQSPT